MMIERFKYNYKINSLLFDILWVIFLGYHLFRYSAWYALSTGNVFSVLTTVVRYGTACMALILVIYNSIHRIYRIPDIIFYVAIGIMIFISAAYSHNDTYIWYFAIFAAAYQQDAGRVVFLTLCISGFILLALVVCSQTGLAVDYIFDQATRGRHSLGFSWTTTPAILFLFWILGYLFLRRERARFYEYLILEGIAVYFYLMTDTNLTFFLSTTVLLFFFVEGLLKNRWRFWGHWNWLFVSLPVLLCAASIVIVMLYHRDGNIWKPINALLHNRLTLGQNGIQNYGVTLFGQPIWWRGFYITVSEVYDYNYVDNSYLQMLLEFGVSFILVVLAVYTRGMARAVKIRDYYLAWILVAVLGFSLMEPWLMSLPLNIFSLMAFLKMEDAGACNT